MISEPKHDAITRVIDQASMTTFAGMLSYRYPQFERHPRNHHTDPEIARSIGLPGTVAQALHYCGALSHLMLEKYGEQWLVGGGFDMKFLRPVIAGDEITVEVAGEGDTHRVECYNQRRELVAIGTATTGE